MGTTRRRAAIAAALVLIVAVAGLGIRQVMRGALPSIPQGEPSDVVFAHTTGDGVEAISDGRVLDLLAGSPEPSDVPTITPGPASVPTPEADLGSASRQWLIVGSMCEPSSRGALSLRICYGVLRMAESDSTGDVYALSVTLDSLAGDVRWAAVRAVPRMAAQTFSAWPDATVDGPCGTATRPAFGMTPHCGRADGLPASDGGWLLEWRCSADCASELEQGGHPTPLQYVVKVAEGTAPDWRIEAGFGP